MKYNLLAIFIISVLLTLIFFSYNFESKNVATASKFKTKTESKLYPYELSYLKKTWPYLDADPRAYIDALEQAHQLQRVTVEQRLQKGSERSLLAVHWPLKCWWKSC